MPTDKLATAKEQVEHINAAETIRIEEERLRHANALAAAERQLTRPWFASNVVDHRYTFNIRVSGIYIKYCGGDLHEGYVGPH